LRYKEVSNELNTMSIKVVNLDHKKWK